MKKISLGIIVGLIFFLIPTIIFFNSCKKNSVLQSQKTTIDTKKTRSSNTLLSGLNLSQTQYTINNNSVLNTILSTNFITSKVNQANIGLIGSNYTKITDEVSGKNAYLVPLINSVSNNATLIIIPLDELNNIYTVFITNSKLIDGVQTSFLEQLDNNDNIGCYLKTKNGVDKTFDWWVDCLTSQYNNLTDDLQGQLYYAINPEICMVAFVIACSLQIAPHGGLTQQQAHQWLCDHHIINCNLTVFENSLIFESLNKN